MTNELNVTGLTAPSGRQLSIAIENAIKRAYSETKTLPEKLIINETQFDMLRRARNTTSYLAELHPRANIYMFYSPDAALEITIVGRPPLSRDEAFSDEAQDPNLFAISLDEVKPHFIEEPIDPERKKLKGE